MKILHVRNNLKLLHYLLTLLQAETLFWEGADVIQPSKGRYSLFLGISFRHHTQRQGKGAPLLCRVVGQMGR